MADSKWRLMLILLAALAAAAGGGCDGHSDAGAQSPPGRTSSATTPAIQEPPTTTSSGQTTDSGQNTSPDRTTDSGQITNSANPRAQQSGRTGDAGGAPAYAGSAACRACHSAEYAAWRVSDHALAERAISAAADGWAFRTQPPANIRNTQPAEVRIDEGRFEIIAADRDGVVRPFAAERALGRWPLRQFLIPIGGGRYQVSELAFDPQRCVWFDVFGDEHRRPGEWGHWTGRGMNWNAMCAACHNTALRKGYDAASDSYHTTRAEMGVGCEACHGPSADHVAFQRGLKHSAREDGRDARPTPGIGGSLRTVDPTGDPAIDPANDPSIQRFRDLSRPDVMLETCAACHARRTELADGFAPGQRFGDAFILAIPDETETWYADGQVHEEDYVYTSFLSSRMYAEGVRCKDCHDVHTTRTLKRGNALCLRCHQNKLDWVEHTHHDMTRPGGQCVSCHMPQTVYMQRDARRDHGFTIPDPTLTRDYGIPNACNRCHSDRSTEWAIEATQRWYPTLSQRWSQQRARWIARARAGDEAVVPALLDFVRREPKPIWRAIGATLLARWADRPEVAAALQQLLADKSYLVRGNAVRSLRPQTREALAAMMRLLGDPVRAVRIAAGWALGGQVRADSRVGQELRTYLEHNADQPLGVVLLASFLREHNQPREAIERLQRAIAWQPDQDGLYYELGLSLATLGRPAEAAAALERACDLSPDRAQWWYSLGLARSEAGDLAEAESALVRACELEPGFVRAWYNLGLLRNRRGQAVAAVKALREAARLAPRDDQVWFALAAVLRDAGRTEDARRVAEAILQRNPTHGPARALLNSLGPRP